MGCTNEYCLFIRHESEKPCNIAAYFTLGVIMSISTLLSEFQSKFQNNGSFTLKPGQSISTAVREHNVPNQHGVYAISSLTDSLSEFVYFGKAGTITSDGHWKEQGLRKRLTRKQGNESRVVFFRRFIEENGLAGLHFEWFVTFGAESTVLPIFAEAQLLQAFFNEHGRLPKLNTSA